MAYCPQCGTQITGLATFCDNCGASLPVATASPVRVRSQWTGAIAGAVLAFAFVIAANMLFVGIAIREFLNLIPPADRPPPELVQAARRPLLGGLVYAGHLVPFDAEQDVRFKAQGASWSGRIGVSLSLPLTGYLLVPALGLLLGGYVAVSLGRPSNAAEGARQGAVVAAPYTLLMLLSLLVLPAHSSVDIGALMARYPELSGPSSLGGAPEQMLMDLDLGPHVLVLAIFAMLWGICFGAVGGAWSAGGSARKLIREGLTARLKEWGPGAYGALAAIMVGLVVATIVGPFALLKAMGTPRDESQSQPQRPVRPSERLTGSVPVFTLVTTVVQAAPSVGALAYPLLHGLPAGSKGEARGAVAGNAFSFYGHANVSLLTRTATAVGGGTGNPETRDRQKLPFWLSLGLLVPAVALIIGGRIAGGLSRGQPPATVGARLGVWYAVALLPVWYFTKISVAGSGSATVPVMFATQTIDGSFSASAGYSLPALLLAGIAWAMVFGTLGARLAGASLRFCDSCGSAVVAGAGFCDRCGARLV